MAFKYKRSVNSLIRLLFVVGLLAIFYLGWQYAYLESTFFDAGNYVVMFSYAVMLILFMGVYGGLRAGSLRISNLFLSCFFALLFANFFMYLELSLISRTMLDVPPILLIQLGQTLFAMFGCYVMNTVYYAMNSIREVVAIYSGDVADEAVIAKMQQFHNRFSIAKVVDAAMPTEQILAAVDQYDSVLLGAMEPGRRLEIFNYCYRKGKRINIIPEPADIALNVAHQTQLFDTPILLCKNSELTPEQRLVKRLIDLSLALVLLVIVSPIMLLCALAIKLHDGGPVFFRQKRLTFGGKTFSIIKFRTMCVDADKDRNHEALRAVHNDARITKIGAFLRPYRLDELPQLFNVITGDMSIVGPRPERVEHYELYGKNLPDFSLRLRAKAGLTGYAQIFGRYNTTPKDKLNLDLFYIESYSLLQDLRLMFMTIKILFVRESSAAFDDVMDLPAKDATEAQRKDQAVS